MRPPLVVIRCADGEPVDLDALRLPRRRRWTLALLQVALILIAACAAAAVVWAVLP